MRVVHTINSLGVGGAESCLLRLISVDAAEDSHMIICIIEDLSLAPQVPVGVPVHCLISRKGKLRNFFRVLRAIRRFRPELIQGWMYWGNFLGVLIRIICSLRPKLLFGIRQTLSWRNEKFVTKLSILLNKLLLSVATVTIYNSNESLNSHGWIFGRHANRIVFNGFKTLDRTDLLRNRKLLRESMDISENAYVIGFVGRNRPMKNFEGFIQLVDTSFRRLPLRELNNVVILVVGKDYSPSLRERLTLIGRRFFVRVIFQSNIPCFHKYASALDLLVSTSAHGESFPNVIAECIAAGVQVLATEVGLVEELVMAENLFDVSDIDSMAERCSVLIDSKGKRLANTTPNLPSCSAMADKFGAVWDSFLSQQHVET